MVTSRSISLNAATEIEPVSSLTISARQSVSSVMPMPARWRVPTWLENAGLTVSGRKQAAAAMRSFWIMTAPSCNAVPGRKIERSRSWDTCASRLTPLSINVRSPISRSMMMRAPVLSRDRAESESRISAIDSGRTPMTQGRPAACA